jgi:hypothetical protein
MRSEVAHRVTASPVPLPTVADTQDRSVTRSSSPKQRPRHAGIEDIASAWSQVVVDRDDPVSRTVEASGRV